MKYLFTHTDLDGAGCAVLFKLRLYFNNPKDQEENKIFYCDYGSGKYNINTKLMELINSPDFDIPDDEVFITDICPSEDVLNKLIYHEVNFRVFDHHKTAKPLDALHWRIVVEDSTNQSGTSLFYNYLFPDFRETYMDPAHMYYNDMKGITRFVENVRLYDTYLFKKENREEPKKLAILFGLLGMQTFVEAYVRRYDTWQDMRQAGQFAATYLLFIEAQMEKETAAINYFTPETIEHTMVLHNRKLAVVYSKNNLNASEFGYQFLSKYSDFDGLAVVNVGRKSVELRTIKDDYDISALAKEYGGGGHPKAAGFQIDSNTLNALMTSIFTFGRVDQ